MVTPLTTVIAEMVNQGTTKEDAMSLMVDAFGLPPSLDVTNYDPIKNASEGSSDAALVPSKWGRSGEHFQANRTAR